MGYAIAFSELQSEHFGESTQWAVLHFRMTVIHREKDTCRLEVTWQRNQPSH
jgi:hypothetical protein